MAAWPGGRLWLANPNTPEECAISLFHTNRATTSLPSFYGALDVHFVAEEFIAGSEQVVAIGRLEGATRKARVPIDLAFVHVWTVGDGRLQRLRAFTDTAVLARALAND